MNRLKIKILLCLLIGINYFSPLLINAKILNNFNERNIINKDIKWDTIKTVHFNIYYPVKNKNLGLITARYAKNANNFISNYLNYSLTKVVEIIVLPSIKYKNTINLNKLKFNNSEYNETVKNRIFIYFKGDYHKFCTELTREIVFSFYNDIFYYDYSGKHLLFISKNNVHSWLLNGLAHYIASGYNSYDDMIIRNLIINNKKSFNISRLYIWKCKNNITLAKSFFYFFEKKYSKKLLTELIKDFRDINNFEKALTINTGEKPEVINKNWIKFYKERYAPLNKINNTNDYLKYKEKLFILAPGISPDGKKITYLKKNNQNISICIKNLLTNKEIEIFKYFTSNIDFSIAFFDNSASWGKDSNSILFKCNKNKVIIYSIKNKKVIKEINFPFINIKNPEFSNDKRHIIFVGYKIFSNDIYLYTIKTKNLKKLTNNKFNKRNPKLSIDNRFLIYSSNINKNNNLQSNKYTIIIHDLKNNNINYIGKNNCNNLHAQLDKKNKNLLFTSDKSGIYNIYSYNLKTKSYRMLTDNKNGLFYPDFIPENNKFSAVRYINDGSHIQKLLLNTNHSEKIYYKNKEAEITDYKLTEKQFEIMQYSFQFDDFNYQFLFDASNKKGYSPELQIGLKDKLGNHKIVGAIQGYTNNELDYEIDYDIKYSYLRFPLNFTLGSFRQNTPYGYYSLNNVADYFYNCHSDDLNFKKNGFFSELSYPIINHLNIILSSSIYQYRKNSNNENSESNISENIVNTRLALHFNNIIYGLNRKYTGTEIKLGANFLQNINKEKYSAYNFDMQIDQYFHIFDYSLFKINLISGYLKESEDIDYYNYYLGGDNNLPAYEYGEFPGNKLGLLKTEFDLSLAQSVNMGFLGNISLRLAFFSDLGACWDKEFHYMNENKTEYDDLIIDVGSGLLINSDQKIFFRFDCVWPYFYKRFGEEIYLFNIKIRF